MTSTAIWGRGSVAVAGIAVGGKANERAANAGLIIFAIVYLLVILIFGLIMVPLTIYLNYIFLLLKLIYLKDQFL